MNEKDITANFFDIGYQSGLNALEYIAKHNERRFLNENPHHEQLAGLLSSIMNCIYYYSPSEKAANNIVKFAVDFAISENQKIGMYLPKGGLIMYVIDFKDKKIARFDNQGLMLFMNDLFKYRDQGLINQRYFLVNNKKLVNKIIKQALGGKPI